MSGCFFLKHGVNTNNKVGTKRQNYCKGQITTLFVSLVKICPGKQCESEASSEIRFPATRRTQLAVGTVSIVGSAALQLSLMDLRRETVMSPIAVRWILRVFALAD